MDIETIKEMLVVFGAELNKTVNLFNYIFIGNTEDMQARKVRSILVDMEKILEEERRLVDRLENLNDRELEENLEIMMLKTEKLIDDMKNSMMSGYEKGIEKSFDGIKGIVAAAAKMN